MKRWEPDTPYAVHDRIHVGGHLIATMVAAQAGLSGPSRPIWGSPGSEVVDGMCRWALSVGHCEIEGCAARIDGSAPHLMLCREHVGEWRNSPSYKAWRAELSRDVDSPAAGFESWLKSWKRFH